MKPRYSLVELCLVVFRQDLDPVRRRRGIILIAGGVSRSRSRSDSGVTGGGVRVARDGGGDGGGFVIMIARGGVGRRLAIHASFYVELDGFNATYGLTMATR